MHTFLINGKPQAGKSKFCQQVCRLVYPYGVELSTVDLVKELARKAGWDGKKTPEARKGLSDLKDVLTVWLDAPVKDIKRAMKLRIEDFEARGADSDKLVFFINVREPYEIERLAKELNAKTILFKRAAIDDLDTSNHADADVEFYNYDMIIKNDGTLQDLAMAALDFVASEGLPLRPEPFKFDEYWNFCYKKGESECLE